MQRRQRRELTINGTLSPGNSPGILALDSTDLVLGSSANTVMGINGETFGTGSDQMLSTNVSSLTYGETLTLQCCSALSTGTFNIFQFGLHTASGSLASIQFGSGAAYTSGTWKAQTGGLWTGTSGSMAMEFRQVVNDVGTSSGQFVIVPEPLALGLLGSGSGVAVLAIRRYRRRRPADQAASRVLYTTATRAYRVARGSVTFAKEHVVSGRTPSAGRKSCLEPFGVFSIGRVRTAAIAAALLVAATTGQPVAALDVAGYSPTVNDRFVSGFPGSPVSNTSGSFVGAGLDWSGVGWSAADATKGFGFITPQHYLVARHYGGAASVVLRSVAGTSGTLRTVTQASVTDTGYGFVVSGTVGDLSLGRLTAAMPTDWGIARYAVLDLNLLSSVNSSYDDQPLLVYGRGATAANSPRIGAAVINGTVLSGANSFVTSSLTGGTSVHLQVGDSGSPIFIPWTNPVGGRELTILGNNAAYDASDNIYNAIGNSFVMGALNGLTTPDGFALKVRGNVNALWTGSASTLISAGGNWSGGSRTDQYVGFQADGAVPTTVTVDAATTLRGLYFGAGAGASAGFTFAGANALTIGRGGLTNYSSLGQTFSTGLTLGDHQYWDVGTGGVTAAAINTNGRLLEIAGSGTARISGPVSGSGGLALSGRRLELTGSSSYTGATRGHAGTMVVDGVIAASSGVVLDAGATLAGTGRVSGISGAGTVGPGDSPGILTATSLAPAGGLDFSFEFTTTGAPSWATGTASGNDVLRLTSGSAFSTSLNAGNAIDVFLGVGALGGISVFQGGLFTDAAADFLTRIQNATFTYYVLGDGAGTAKTTNGQGYYLLDTNFWGAFERVDVATVTVATANFADGTVTNGRVMQLTVVPEPAAIWPTAACLIAAAEVVGRRRWRRSGRAAERRGGPTRGG